MKKKLVFIVDIRQLGVNIALIAYSNNELALEHMLKTNNDPDNLKEGIYATVITLYIQDKVNI